MSRIVNGARRSCESVLAVLTLALSAAACSSQPVTGSVEDVGATQQRSVVAPGFQENQLLQGHVNPVGIRFIKAAGPLRAVVFEKGGKVYYYDDLANQTSPAQAKLVADLSNDTHNFWDRGLLGLAVDPNFPATPRLYVLTTYDPGNFWNDGCSDATGAGCVVNGRLSRLTLNMANPGSETTVEQPLLDAHWCMQYPSHATGDLQFGADGYLYASSGDGASFNFLDWGHVDGLVQGVLTKNVCNDPGALDPQGRLLLGSSEGGQLRSQDVQTGGDNTGYNGTILRMDVSGTLPVAPPTNPLVGKGSTSDDLIIATGLRNPYRFNMRPGTNEVWIADVGEGQIEEINRIVDPGGSLENFGWPCFEGAIPRFSGNSLCDQVKAGTFAPSVSPQALTQPYYAYRHDEQVAAGDGCGPGGSSITGVAFNDKSTYPAEYGRALFFADSTRQCVWSMRQGASGQPDPSTRAVLVQGAAGRVVDLQMANDGRLYYVDFDGGRVFRIDNFVGNQPPQAACSATPSDGPAPLTVQLSAAQSLDAEGDVLSYSWDLNGDGMYGDALGVAPQYTFTTLGAVTVSVLVTDTANNSDTASVLINVGNSAPAPSITTPVAPFSWASGDVVAFSGSAQDAEDGALTGASLSWQLSVRHCHELPQPGEPEDCHDHPVQTFSGASGSFVAPDHAYYSYLLLRLTATDSAGLSASTAVRLEPRAVQLRVESVPPGIAVTIGEHEAHAAPSEVAVLMNGHTSLQVESPQTIGARSYAFVSWSNGGTQLQTVQPLANTTLSVVFQDVGPAPACASNPLSVVAATASSIESPETPEGEAFDGIINAVCGAGGNRWSSQFSDPQWIYADLGAERHLSEVVLHWECAYASNYDLQVAHDGADPTSDAAYTTVYSNAASTGGQQTVGNLDAKGRYVRVYTRARATPWGSSLYEVVLKGDTNPQCTTQVPFCGDGTCNVDETCTSCAADCGACPGRSIASNLEAETNDGQAGVQFEATTDTGGGQNAGWIDNTDYIEWRIEVPSTGSYAVTTRSATWAAATLQVVVDGGVPASLSLPSTWNGTGNRYQTWASFTTTAFNLTAGTHVLRIRFTSGSQNLNWIKVAPAAVNLLSNGALTSDLAGWVSYFMAPVGTATWDAGAVKIAPASAGPDWWAQFFQSKTLLAGNYRLTANAQTVTGTKSIALFCEQDGGAYTSYGQAACSINTAWNAGVGCSVTCNNVPAGIPIKLGVKGGLDTKAFRLDNLVLTKL